MDLVMHATSIATADAHFHGSSTCGPVQNAKFYILTLHCLAALYYLRIQLLAASIFIKIIFRSKMQMHIN